MTKRRSAMLGVLVLGFGGATMTGACGPPLDPGPLDSCPALPATPADEPTECVEPTTETCMRYRISLLGDPSSNVALRGKYIAAFGSACYTSAGGAFNCFYETWEEACKEAVKIGQVSGNDPYEQQAPAGGRGVEAQRHAGVHAVTRPADAGGEGR